MSKIFMDLGADSADVHKLWIAAPITGLLVQPIIGYLSDNTWHKRLGRRRPYFLIGAILASITLFFVPHSPALWVAAGCLWVLDGAINISMEPFRALVADKLNDKQRSNGFVVQTLIIGIGTWIASNLPRFLDFLGFGDGAELNKISDSVIWAFAIGAIVYILSIIYTVVTTKEYPPEDLGAFREKQKNMTFKSALTEIFESIKGMNGVMKKLGVIQFFSWFAFFTMWSMANPALTDHVYQSPSPDKSEYNLNIESEKNAYLEAQTKYDDASNLVGSHMGVYGLTSMAFALLLTLYTSKKRINRRNLHLFSLVAGGVGFISMFYVKDQSMLAVSFGLIGIAWASILSMPYAMLSSSIPSDKMGFYMGLFNMFIVLPQIVAALAITWIYTTFFGEDVINAMIMAGSSLLLGALACLLIRDKSVMTYVPKDVNQSAQ